MIPFKKIFAIVNPNSGNGAARKRWPHIKALMEKTIGRFEYAFTRESGGAVILAAEAFKKQCDLVISVGGDGTIHEIVNGLLAAGSWSSLPALAFIPCGSGCDLIKTLGISQDIAIAIQEIAEGSVHRIDVARITYTDHEGQKLVRYGVNITSFGIGGLVDQLANSTTKMFGGKVAFIISILKALFQFKNQQVRISCDGGTPKEMVINNVVIANGRYFGGGILIAPEAKIDNGFFDVVILGDLSLMEVMLHWPKAYRGAHLTHPKVRCFRARTIVAEPVNPKDHVLIDLDGEAPGRLPATFEILPGVLPVLC